MTLTNPIVGWGRLPPRVVIARSAEDDEWPARLRARLDPSGIRTERAASARDVVRFVESRSVRLAVLADAPRLDGLSILRMIRTVDAALPCVLVARGPDRRWLERALTLRASSVFGRPLDLDRMVEVVAHLVHEYGDASGHA